MSSAPGATTPVDLCGGLRPHPGTSTGAGLVLGARLFVRRHHYRRVARGSINRFTCPLWNGCSSLIPRLTSAFPISQYFHTQMATYINLPISVCFDQAS